MPRRTSIWRSATIPGSKRARVFAGVLLAVLVSGSQPIAWADEPPSASPTIGERVGFHGRWLGVPVGYGWIEVVGQVEIDGRQALHIHAEGHTNDVLSTFYPIHDTIDSYLDPATLQPLRFEKHQREGRYRADEVVTFDHAKRLATYRSLLNGSVKEVPLANGVQDIISALYWFRAQPLAPGRPLTVDIYTDEKVFQTSLELKGPITLELLKRGTFSCLVAEPKAAFKGLLVKRGRIWAYFTDDRYRMPLLIQATTPWGRMSAVIDEASLPPELASRLRLH